MWRSVREDLYFMVVHPIARRVRGFHLLTTETPPIRAEQFTPLRFMWMLG